jgi:hypothetical protein
MLRFSALLACLFVAWPSVSLAQDHGPSLQVAALSCPECACERARSDLALMRPQYASLHRKVSTLAPRIVTLAGFAAAGAAAYVSIFALAAAGQMPARDARLVRTVAALGISVPLGVGFGGLGWLAKKREDSAPYREREAELRIAYKEARRHQKQQCRGVPRR